MYFQTSGSKGKKLHKIYRKQRNLKHHNALNRVHTYKFKYVNELECCMDFVFK